ncbi:uncharacterized protein LOC111642774 [Copidosoma floridanum]|uniref:uncharacterized protein LOC111642774 n=1 Tax=Copidosoma floridanum TaxID=29053 RepID=UPI000C6F6C0E|nr:uncharacterized protein LOC111642774 [Copidosoma floridanum]
MCNATNFGGLYSIMANKALFELSLVNDSAEYKGIALIDMNNCNSVHLDFPDDDYYHLLVYDNSFHVTTKNKEKCGQEHSPCMIRYNHDGEQIGEPVPFPPKNYRQGYAMVVDRHNSSSGGFFTTYEKIDRNEYQMNVSRVSNDGTEMVLLKNYVVRKNVEGAQVQSNEYGYFSFCHRQFELRGVITCKQYDTMGQVLINGWFYLPWKHKMIKVFNLRRGGMILMYFKCSSFACASSNVKLRVMSYKDARYVQLTKVGLYTYSGREGQEFSIDHMETETQHCFYFVNGPKRWRDKKTVFRYMKKCIKK